jgi:hypothetical protein
MTSWIELRVRRFFTCEEADVTPAITYVVSSEIVPSDFPASQEVMHLLQADVADVMVAFPATNLREMTREEVDRYIADEMEEK